MASELKNCPLCNGTANQEYNCGEPYVRCVDCGCSVDGMSGAWNTRPAAPVEGLETSKVEHRVYFPGEDAHTEWREGYGMGRYPQEPIVFVEVREHVTRSQAEAIIAATTTQRDALIEAGLKCCNGTPNPNLPRFELALSFINSTNEARKAADMVCKDLKADNAALTARVKELEKANIKWMDLFAQSNNRADDLRDKLTAARKDAETWEANFKALNAKYADRAALEAKP